MDKKISRWWDIPAALLLIVALEVSAFRLRITGWTPSLGIIEALAFLACLLGFALGYSNFRPAIVWLFGLVFTLFFIPLELGLTMEPSSNVEWWDRLNDLYARLYYSIYDFLHTRPVQDPLLFITVMALFFWVIGLLAGYQLIRNGKPWGPLIVSGLGLLIIDFYNPYAADRDRFSGVFVFLILFLVARMYFLRSRREWAERGSTVDPEIGFDLGRTVAISGLALVLVAWNMPVLVAALTPGTTIQKELARQWETLRDKLQNAVAGLKSPVVSSSDFYGSNLTLGAGGTRDDQLVFTVKVSQPLPQGVRLYWKARSYDTYDGAWSNTDTNSKAIGPNEWPFKYPDWKGRSLVDFDFTSSSSDIRNIYIPEFPVSVSVASDVIGNIDQDGTLDYVGLMADPSLSNGQQFTERSWVTAVAISQLRSASNIYPSPIRSTYLQLPADFNTRIRNLAIQIAGRQPSQYDKVVAITNWLRSNITYKEAIDTPPQGIDPITWFLFTYKQGFCNYYASAEVLMLRSIGIPARLAVGYAQGQFDDTTNTFSVKRRDAHAWPEVYFTGFGWVEFEPTASQPATNLAETASSDSSAAIGPTTAPPLRRVPTPIERNQLDQPVRTSNTNTFAWWMAIPLVLVVGLVALLVWLQRQGKINIFSDPLPVMIEHNMQRRGLHIPNWLSQWARLAELTPIERMYTRLSWALPLFGQKADPSNTPSERFAQLASTIPAAESSLQEFLGEYQRAVYSPQPVDVEKASKANGIFWQHARRAFINRLRHSISK
jgi:transglutaminase-like putative cysteine protease